MPGVDPVQVVQDTAARVRFAAISILNHLDTEKVPDGRPPGLDRDDPALSTPTGRDLSRPAPETTSVEQPGL